MVKQETGSVKKEPMSFMMKTMLKSFVPMIADKLQDADSFIQKTLSEQVLNPNEEKAVFMLTTGADGIAYIITCAIKGDTMVRIISKAKLTEFVTNIIKQV